MDLIFHDSFNNPPSSICYKSCLTLHYDRGNDSYPKCEDFKGKLGAMIRGKMINYHMLDFLLQMKLFKNLNYFLSDGKKSDIFIYEEWMLGKFCHVFFGSHGFYF